MQIVLICAALVLFGFGLVFCYRDKPTIKAIFTAGVFCLIFAFLPEFKHFEGFGVKAERLEEKIEEADETIAQLRSLSKPLAELLFTMVARSGRLGTVIPRRDRYRIMEQLESELRNVGLTESEIEDAKRDWHRFNLFDLSYPIIDRISALVKEKKKEQQKRINSISKPVVTDIEAHNKEVRCLWHIAEEENRLKNNLNIENIESAYSGITDFIHNTDIFDDSEREDILAKNKEELEDLEYYSKHKEFRRLEHWFKSE